MLCIAMHNLFMTLSSRNCATLLEHMWFCTTPNALGAADCTRP